MFTRYKGTSVPENYSGIRFRDSVAPPTEMKMHKPSPSYTSTKTSVSPMFRSMQMQRNQSSVEVEKTPEVAKESAYTEGILSEWENEAPPISNGYNGECEPCDRANECEDCTDACRITHNCNADECCDERKRNGEQCKSNASVRSCKQHQGDKLRKNNLRSELGGLLDTLFKGIKGEDFLLLAVMLLILGEDKECNEGAKCPSAATAKNGFFSLFKGETKGALLPLALLLLYS